VEAIGEGNVVNFAIMVGVTTGQQKFNFFPEIERKE